MQNHLYSMPFHDLMRHFIKRIEEKHKMLKTLDNKKASLSPAPGKWCIKEIVGHLIDSASNNHQRFLRACTQDNLIFLPYEQDNWVSIQHYKTYPWPQLTDFWRLYNLHLASVMESIPENIRIQQTTDHNFDRIAFNEIPKGQASSLDYFMRDYVVHWEHHVRQMKM